jgi:hypothetical protein
VQLYVAELELRAHSGTKFCPQVMAALELIYREQPALLVGTLRRPVGKAAA